MNWLGTWPLDKFVQTLTRGIFDSKFKHYSGLQVAFITFYTMLAHTLSYHFTFQNTYLWLVDFLVTLFYPKQGFRYFEF